VTPTFAGVYAKLDRADEHLAELKGLLLEHMTRPDLVSGTVEYDATEQKLYRDWKVQTLPPKIPVVAGDVVHNLRSALDHTVWQLVIANGGHPTSNTQFPICSDPPATGLKIDGGVSEAALDVVTQAQPYAVPFDWPDHPLTVLRHVSNIDKHRELARGTHGIDEVLLWYGDHEPTTPWKARLEVGEADEHSAKVRFVPLPDDVVDVGGDARYWVQIEYSEIENSYTPLYSTLDHLAPWVRQLVGRLVLTVRTDPR
jgi:hypothetical protein